MKAVVHDRYGPPEVLRLEDVPRPVPAADEVLVRVHATSATRTDCGLRSAEYWFTRGFTGLLRPKSRFIGLEFAGVVEEVGTDVTELTTGDRVFGIRTAANAEYVCVKESGTIARIPDGIEFAAALADGALSALSIMKAHGVDEGDRIVVYGASGSIGTAAVQIGKYLGAHVTGVCSPENMELVRSLGADVVVDYTREHFARRGETYDLVFDAVGKSSFLRARRAVKPGASYVSTDLGFLYHGPLAILATKWIGKRKAKLGLVRYRKDDLSVVRELLAAGRYRAVIDRVYPLEEVVEAHRYVDRHEKTGNVVLRVAT